MDTPLNMQAAKNTPNNVQQTMAHTIVALFANDKGILAMDESNLTCNEHFAQIGVAQTEATRRDWRDKIITTVNLAECISGVILYDETIRQSKMDGTPFTQALKKTGF